MCWWISHPPFLPFLFRGAEPCGVRGVTWASLLIMGRSSYRPSCVCLGREAKQQLASVRLLQASGAGEA